MKTEKKLQELRDLELEAREESLNFVIEILKSPSTQHDPVMVEAVTKLMRIMI